ncbi:CheY-like receiver [Candidatus Nitrosarchaeum limnium SFB1]|jgi:two-component system chemotaxis response regulator CheY|uniref:CheY-like receiver n=1 Tax=Candidatus Nitrosarchaeum limnium SFB1 TaxID=886738 RepID=F3KJX1_9ARCH|nr:CheY-like receiver [Candidatus Nitrosarchaeum limnium SFB1]
MSARNYDILRYSKILIVDDSPFTRATIKKMLVEAKIGSGHYEAGDGKEAISQYVTRKPTLVIMDIVMPNIDGVQATKAIIKYDPNAKIIVISAKENKEIVNDAIRAGAKNYVLKPLDAGQITMAISKQLVTNRSQLSK